MLKIVFSLIHTFTFWFFVTVKVAGVTFASWSWWWLLLPQIPCLSILVQRWGL